MYIYTKTLNGVVCNRRLLLRETLGYQMINPLQVVAVSSWLLGLRTPLHQHYRSLPSLLVIWLVLKPQHTWIIEHEDIMEDSSILASSPCAGSYYSYYLGRKVIKSLIQMWTIITDLQEMHTRKMLTWML